MLWVTSSPASPSPRVDASISLPFSYINVCPLNTRSDVDSYFPADTYIYPHIQPAEAAPSIFLRYCALPISSLEAEILTIISAPFSARSLPGETGAHASSQISIPTHTFLSVPNVTRTVLPKMVRIRFPSQISSSSHGSCTPPLNHLFS